MSKHWLEANASRLMAEILRDFCSVSVAFEEQFMRFDRAGNLSYAVLREILGDQMDRGILWRLKDTAHHILRDAPGSPVAEQLLDWAIGYLFHETWKLLEDTHQHQYYASSLAALVEDTPTPEMEAIARDFTLMAEENHKEVGRKVARIRRLLAHARLFFHHCYADQAGNLHLARLLHDNEELVRKAFTEEYANLITAIYGDAPQRLFIDAALSLRYGGRTQRAQAALERARSLAPNDPRIAEAARSLETA